MCSRSWRPSTLLMVNCRFLPSLVLTLLVIVESTSAVVYLNKWAVKIHGGLEVANAVAQQNGFRNLGQIGTLENYYLLEQRRIVRRSVNPSIRHHVRLENEPKVTWLEQQTIRRRVKRDVTTRPKNTQYWNDPLWPRMWYLNRGMFNGVDMNVMNAWELGYSGRGVVVTILDDGIEHNHTDLQPNYDPTASWDINSMDDDPMPRYDASDDNRHGTRCAGQVAAVANNSKCTVGVAYRSSIGGIRMLDGDVSDFVEAHALSFNSQHIDIYSASWGPEDNGKVIEGPATLARQAFLQGVTKGRRGLGSIYIWASGNGGSRSDSCSCDGYTNSVYTLSVSSTSEHGTKPWYLEECSSTIAATYSSGENYRDRKIVTTDLHNRCTDDHTGTSASAPLAAGICALALEANPELTWRDMQHIVILSARTEPLKDAHWVTNGVKRKVSHRYGYGLMDAYSMVQLAERWTTVPEQRICATDLIVVNHTLERRGASFEVSTNGCFGSANEINFLEHVQAKVTLNYSRRGDLQLYLVSPSGTRSTLFPRRKDDFQAGKLDAWPFLSVFYWGENPNGTWTLTAENGGSILNSGLFESWQLIFYGTETRPVNLTNSPVYRTKSPPLPITPVVPVKNDTSLVDGDARSNILDNNTMLNATHVEPVTLKTASASLSMSSINSQGSLQDSTSFKLESTAKTELTTNVPFPSSTEVLVDATFVSEMLQPTIVTSTSPATETEASPSSTSHSEIHSTESLYPDDQLPSNGSVNCTTVQSGVCNGTSVDSAIEPSSSTSTVTSHTTTDDHAILSSTKTDIVVDETSTLPVIDNRSSTRTVIESFECDSECSDDGCNGPLSTDCLSCKHAQIADNRQCVSACPSVMFHNQTSGQCQSCPSACDECAVDVTRQFLNCYHCIKRYFLLAIDDVTLCVQYCPSSYFADDASGVCKACSIECSECESSASRCIQCADGYDMIDFNCFPRCELSEYREQDGSCQQCDSSCVTCVGPLSDDCIQCSEALWYEDGLCVPNCSDGRYSALINDEKFCQMCYPSCLTCFGPNELDCFMCFHPLKLVGTTCVEACPPGFYEIIDEAMCYPCDNNCETCHGPDSDNCLTCHQNLLLHLGQCVASCPSGFFEVFAANETTVVVTTAIFQVNDRSVSYGENTERASNLINTESSSGGLITWGEVSHDNTVSRVVSRTISSGESTGGPSKWCEPCHPTCQQCVDLTESNCTECDEGLLLSRGYCVQQCDQAFYADGQRCERCDPNCEKCDGPSDVDCISCHDGWYLYASFCVTSCPEGFFNNNESRTCQRCQGDCWTCDSQSSCTTCFAPLVLHQQQCTVCCSADDEYIAEDDCCVCDETMSSCLQPTTGGSLTSVTTASSVAAAERTITPFAETTTSTTSDSVKTTILAPNTDVTVILKWPTTASAPSDLSSYSILTMDSSTPVVTTDLTSSTSLPNRTSIVPSPETALPSQSAPLHVALTSVTDGDDTDPTETLPTTVSVEDVALVTRDVVTELDRLDEETVADQTTSASLVTTVTLTSAVPPMVYPLISPWLFVLVAVFVTSSVLLASLVFCLVRARSQHKLCWTKHRCYLPVTLLYHNGTDALNTAATATLPTKVSTELAPLTPV